MSFRDQLAIGKAGESAIAKWLIRRGNSVLPVYEKIIDEGKGPQLYTGGGGLVAPDLFAFTEGWGAYWIEAKHKTAFTWWRIGRVFETGIDLRHYEDYLKVAEITCVPVWMLFLHKGGQAKDSPESPSGLFGNDISVLSKSESHRDERWGKSGMVYWTREHDGGPLKFIAEYSEVMGSLDFAPAESS